MDKNQFDFKCPQCGQMVSADESMRGLTVSCPCCKKGIVIPKNVKKMILAPISQEVSPKDEVDYNFLAIQRRLATNSEQNAQQTEMTRDNKGMKLSSIVMIGLLIIIGAVAFDIFSALPWFAEKVHRDFMVSVSGSA